MSLYDEVGNILKENEFKIRGNTIREAVKGVTDIVTKLVKATDFPIEVADKFNSFADDEATYLYLSDSYRDHFFHPFHVFALGYRILQDFRNLSIQPATHPFDNSDKFLKEWLLTSLWHDISYASAKGPEWLKAFSLNKFKINIDVSQNWSVMMQDKDILRAIDRIADVFVYHYAKEEIRLTFKAWFHTQMFEQYDHGILSAIYLLKDEENWTNWPINATSKETLNECALAISLHNYSKAFSEGNSQTIKPACGTLEVKAFKLSYLLAYCDAAQEWGRPNNKGTSNLLRFVRTNMERNDKKYNIKLKYLKDNIAKDILEKERAKGIQLAQAWKSDSWKFWICQDYYESTGSAKVARNNDFVCNYI